MVLLFTSLYLTNELHFEIAEAGLCMSFYGIGAVLGAYTGGWLTDRSNTSGIMIFSLISSGIILLFILIAKTPAMISVVIFLYSFTSIYSVLLLQKLLPHSALQKTGHGHFHSQGWRSIWVFRLGPPWVDYWRCMPVIGGCILLMPSPALQQQHCSFSFCPRNTSVI